MEDKLEQLIQESIEVNDLEVGGVKMVTITDRSGKVWSVPADDDNVDPREFAHRGLLNIPNPDPQMYYQYVTDDRLNEYLSTGYFALTKPEDVGLPKRSDLPQDAANAVLGGPSVSHHRVGNLNLIRCPKVIERRYRKAHEAEANSVKRDIVTPRHMGKPIEGAVDLAASGIRIEREHTAYVGKIPGSEGGKDEEK